MKKTRNIVIATTLSLIFLYLIANNKSWGFFFGDLGGKYILHNDGSCPFLSYESDTLFLKDDGSVISNRLPKGTTYIVETRFLEKRVEIFYNYGYGEEKMILLVRRTLFGPIKLIGCLDNSNAHYLKS